MRILLYFKSLPLGLPPFACLSTLQNSNTKQHFLPLFLRPTFLLEPALLLNLPQISMRLLNTHLALLRNHPLQRPSDIGRHPIRTAR